jgi:NAD(P)-dependent dehydrogenase (short-subunit alcohol dehydrogenase family)
MGDATFKGKIVLITGAAKGIGRSVAETLATAGATVVMVDVDASGKGVADSIEASGGAADFVQADLADPAQVDGIVPLVVARHGTIDILINNAIRCPIKSLVEMEQAEFDAVMQVNFRSTVQLTRKAMTVMTGRRRGMILNILSTAGAKPPEVGGAYLSAYAASKGALAAFTLSIAAEVRPLGIHCVGLWVGLTRTPGGEQTFRALAERLHMRYEDFERGMVPSELVAGAVSQILLGPEPYDGSNVDIERVFHVMQGKPIEMPAAAMAVQAQSQPMAPVPVAKDDLGETIAKAHSQSKEVVGAANGAKEGISRLPDFYQPTAKNDFTQRVGEGLDDLNLQIKQLGLWLDNLEAAWKRKDGSSVSVLGGKVIAMYAQREATLRRFAQYLRETAQTSASLFPDPNQAQTFREERTAQASIVDSFCETLHSLQEGLVKYLSK